MMLMTMILMIMISMISKIIIIIIMVMIIMVIMMLMVLTGEVRCEKSNQLIKIIKSVWSIFHNTSPVNFI